MEQKEVHVSFDYPGQAEAGPGPVPGNGGA